MQDYSTSRTRKNIFSGNKLKMLCALGIIATTFMSQGVYTANTD